LVATTAVVLDVYLPVLVVEGVASVEVAYVDPVLFSPEGHTKNDTKWPAMDQ